MEVFHGSPHKFKEFDYGRIRTNGTTEGVGFYFTDSESIARGYGDGGYLYVVDFQGKKALSDRKLTITKAEARKYIEELHKSADFLENYGEVEYQGYDTILAEALENEYGNCDTDTEFMGSLYNACGENEVVVTLLHSVLGYDHIVSKPDWGGKQNLYIALTNDIIKIKKVEKI